ncbi:MAG TPA: hypothetical protein VNI34_09370 [Candidatus Nitrosotalea sp.]|nr:hypothetical protein [Candidatus Nitrosotalea sp.]
MASSWLPLGEPRGTTSRRSSLALVVVILLLRLPSWYEPRWYSDQGLFSTVGMALARGVPLYRGIFDNSPPGIYWIYALLYRLGGAQHQQLLAELAASAAVLASCLLVLRLGAWLLAPRGALLAAFSTAIVLSLPTLDGDLFNVEIAGLPFFLGSLRLCLTRSRLALFGAGCLLGAAVIVRPSYALDGLALIVPLLSGPKPATRVAIFAGGGLSAALGAGLGLAATGSLTTYLTVIMPAEHAYLVWANGGDLYGLLIRLGLLFLLAAWLWRRAESPTARLLAIWVPASLAGSSLTPRELTHYCHEAVPALSLALAYLLARRRLSLAVPLQMASLILALELLLVLPAQESSRLHGQAPPPALAHNFGYAQLPAYYVNWFQYASGGETRARYSALFPGQAAETASEAAALRRLAAGRPLRLVVLGDQPWIYQKSGLLPAGPYITTNTAFWRVPAAPGALRALVASGCAGLLVYVSGPGDFRPEIAAAGYVAISGTPWPTYLSPRPEGCAGITP